MTKYMELVEKYSGMIACIKVQQEKIESARLEVESLEETCEWDEYGPSKAGLVAINEACQKWDDLTTALTSDLEVLAQDIDAEYYNVPFAKTRQAGIEGFWRESGIKLN